ncbi:hypothetical protein QBC37DRAFT_393867 [Rhypophila decipiens]|uniref:Zn(2)-C6 fungal-type domain-containing protein n=1 Tax=Rhypophila decipiens TaxID=261697 RepID=A0AAN7BBU2_9PEZI|nr:hypothetical protein QBC37DRAFT_393867 [Rhypophila decipiens]
MNGEGETSIFQPITIPSPTENCQLGHCYCMGYGCSIGCVPVCACVLKAKAHPFACLPKEVVGRMSTFPDAPGRHGHVRNSGYYNDSWSVYDRTSGNVTAEVPSNDIQYMQESQAKEWLDIAANDPHPHPHHNPGRRLLSDIIGSSSYPPGSWESGSVAAADSCSDDYMDMDLDDPAVDSHSENISVATPPTLTTGTSVDHGGESDDDVQMTDPGPQSPQPHNVWPTLSRNELPLKPTIEFFNASSPSSDSSHGSLPSSESPSDSSVSSPSQSSVQSGTYSAASFSNSSTPYRSSSPNEHNGPRGRILRAPEETNEVRKIGACYRCRIGRVKCDTALVCRKCSVDVSKPGCEFVSKTCIREEPSKVGGVSASRWSWKASRFSPRRDDFIKSERTRLHVRFPFQGRSSRGLEITATPFRDVKGSSNRPLYGIVPDEGPGVDQIIAWVKAQIASNDKQDFESYLEKLHISFVQNNCLDSAVRSDEKTARMAGKPTPSAQPRGMVKTQKDLLKNILSMRCMWKVWSCEKFDVRTPSGDAVHSNWDTSAIEDHLQRVAEQALSSLEKTILRDMDRYLSPSDIRDDRPVLKSAMNAAAWIILWQMILLYRKSVIRTLVQQERDQKEVNAAPFVLGMSPSTKRHKFHEITERLFQGVVVMYSETFRTRKVLEGLRDANESVFGNDTSLHRVFQDTWKAREMFYKHVEKNTQSPDPLLASLVVVKERVGFKKGRGHK